MLSESRHYKRVTNSAWKRKGQENHAGKSEMRVLRAENLVVVEGDGDKRNGGRGRTVLCLDAPPSRPFRGTGWTERRVRRPLGLWAQVSAPCLLLVRGRGASLPRAPRRGHPRRGPPSSGPRGERGAGPPAGHCSAPPLMHIHAARAARPAPSPAGLRWECVSARFSSRRRKGGAVFSLLGIYFRCPVSPPPSQPASLPPPSPLRPRRPGSFVSRPRAHSLNSRRRRGPSSGPVSSARRGRGA